MSAHTRYIGRPQNTNIFVNGYEADTGVLDLTDASAFRSTIVGVLANKFKGKPTRFTTVNGDFILTSDYLPPNIPLAGALGAVAGGGLFAVFPLGYDAPAGPPVAPAGPPVAPPPLYLKNARFMQAVAQYIVITFIQLVVDLQRVSVVPTAPPAAPVVDEITQKNTLVTACQAAIAIALGILRNAALTQPPTARLPASIISAPDRQALLTEVCLVLTGICGVPPAPVVQPYIDFTGDTITITVDSDTSIIPTARVTDLNDMLVYNANIAATLLLAVRNKGTSTGKFEVNNLSKVLNGYSDVRDNVPAGGPAAVLGAGLYTTATFPIIAPAAIAGGINVAVWIRT